MLNIAKNRISKIIHFCLILAIANIVIVSLENFSTANNMVVNKELEQLYSETTSHNLDGYAVAQERIKLALKQQDTYLDLSDLPKAALRDRLYLETTQICS